jgi:cold shock CspA family protein
MRSTLRPAALLAACALAPALLVGACGRPEPAPRSADAPARDEPAAAPETPQTVSGPLVRVGRRFVMVQPENGKRQLLVHASDTQVTGVRDQWWNLMEGDRVRATFAMREKQPVALHIEVTEKHPPYPPPSAGQAAPAQPDEPAIPAAEPSGG